MREEEPASNPQLLQRVLLIAGIVAGVIGVVSIVAVVWCCMAGRSDRRAMTVPQSPTAHNPLLV